MQKLLFLSLISVLIAACSTDESRLAVEIFQTSSDGDQLKKIEVVSSQPGSLRVSLDTSKIKQTIIGFGGAFTESSAYLLNQLSDAKRQDIINAYFSESGANYSLTRTHMNSCDFSLGNYSYAPVDGDTALNSFSIKEDMDDIIPMIKDAQAASPNGFKIVASPWTAPPWMKDNKDWNGGKLLPEYYPVWAKFFTKYTEAYADQGIDIWGFTVENEPLGNDENWESMHYTPEETADFVKNHLGPELKSKYPDKQILGYDQNRGEELKHWADILLGDPELDAYIDGTAVHWYSSTVDWFPESLNYAKDLSPDRYVLHTEACVDAEVPHWQEDSWYWSKEATDWGFDWASEENKVNHPKYVPVYRYARDIIGCMNSQVSGWIDWNMVLDRQGGPNHANNWCVAPVIVDPEADEVYYTPLYYVMTHFSKYVRPGAEVLAVTSTKEELMITAARNPDGTIAIVILNMSDQAENIDFELGERIISSQIKGKAIQTIKIAG